MSEERWVAAGVPVCEAPSAERMAFLQKVYFHLAVAVVGFVAVSGILMQIGVPELLLSFMSRGRFMWLIFVLVFSGIGSAARNLARSQAGPAIQYAGLGLYVLFEAVLMSPLLCIAAAYNKVALISAGVITLTMFVGLTGIVMFLKRDFSFLANVLSMASMGALGLIICSLIFGFDLGMFFAFFMVLVAGGYILYNTSQIFQNYPSDAYVAASLELFASLALLFWYVLRLVMNRRR